MLNSVIRGFIACLFVNSLTDNVFYKIYHLIITIIEHITPLGTVCIKGSEKGIASIRFGKSDEATSTEIPILTQCKRELEEYFAGKRTRFTVKLDWNGTTVFNQKVWTALSDIPYGEVRTYAQIAAQIGSLKAARAVGRANGLNPIAIIVPCHRLIGADGKLCGYAYGLERKQALLDLESVYRLNR